MTKAKAKADVQAKALDKKTGKTLEQFEKALIMLSKVDMNLVDTAILESEFSCRQEEKSLIGYATFAKVLERTKEAKQLNTMLKDAGIGFDTRKQALKAVLPVKTNKSTEEKTSPNLSNFMAFIDCLSRWHEQCHGKAMPKTWVNAEKEDKLSNGTMAVIHLLWQAAKGNMDARKLFTNQTDLNNTVRKLTGSSKYNNPNSGKVFGHFLKWIESN